MHYRMLMEWSDENDCFLVFLPDWEGRVVQPVTDGKTYEEAARNGQEVLELLVQDETDLPEPRIYEQRPDPETVEREVRETLADIEGKLQYLIR